MAKTSLKVKAARKPKFGVRAYTRVQPLRSSALGVPQVRTVRVCLRELAHRRPNSPVSTKSSW